MMKLPTRRSLIVLAFIFTISASAMAQYVWLDENGHKQFSDQAPPASVPKERILKSANKTMDDHNKTSPVVKPDDKATQPESLADKDLAYKKRRDELAAKEKKEEADAKAAATKSEYCRQLKEYKLGLESGQRVSQMNANGTISYMSDEKRAQEMNELQQKMGECDN